MNCVLQSFAAFSSIFARKCKDIFRVLKWSIKTLNTCLALKRKTTRRQRESKRARKKRAFLLRLRRKTFLVAVYIYLNKPLSEEVAHERESALLFVF